MSEEEEKGGRYEKPESKDLAGDDLEDISGGTGIHEAQCRDGAGAVSCASGGHAQGECQTGNSQW